MSSISMKKKSDKHYRMLSTHINIDPQQYDILADLKNYRTSHMKRSSPNKFKNPSSKQQRLYNSHDFRPVTTGSSPKKRNRLWDKHNTIIEAYQSSLSEHVKTLKDSNNSTDLKKFIDNFQFLKPLAIDIEMNADLIRQKVPNSEKAKGIYYLLYEHTHEIGWKMKSSDDFVKYLKEFTAIFRDILRNLQEKSAGDDIINLELLWRVVLKAIDSSLVMQEDTVKEAIDSTDTQIRETIIKSDQDLFEQKNNFESMQTALKLQIADQLRIIKNLKRENQLIDNMLKEKEAYIADLLEPESQNQSCQLMRTVMKKLSAVIAESEIEQIKQVNALRDLSSIMTVAEEMNKKPESVEVFAQTDWTIIDLPLPALKVPKLTNHPFEHVFSYSKCLFPNNIHSELLQICENCLASDGELQYIYEVVLALSMTYKTKEKLASAVLELITILSTDSSCSLRLYRLMLRLNEDISKDIEKSVLQLNTSLLAISEGKYIPFSKLIEFIYTNIEEDKSIWEKILENISYYSNNGIEEKLNILILRLYLACVRSKTINNTQDIMKVDLLKTQIKNHTGLIASDSDFNYLLENLSENTLSSKFSEAAGKIVNIKVEKNSVLLEYLTATLAKITKTSEELNEYWKEDNIEKFFDAVKGLRKETADKSIKSAFIMNFLGCNRLEVMEKCLDYDFTGYNLQRIQLSRLRTPIKKLRIKKT